MSNEQVFSSLLLQTKLTLIVFEIIGIFQNVYLFQTERQRM